MQLLDEAAEGPSCACHRPLSPRRQIACYRTSSVPGGADAKTLAHQADRIRRDMVAMRRLLMVDGMRTLADMMKAFFTSRLTRFCERVLSGVTHTRSADYRSADASDIKTAPALELDFGANEAIWAMALEEVFGKEANIELIVHYLPVAQSVAARACERTALFLGEELAADTSVSILRRAQGMAQEVTRINETTRRQLADRLARGIEERETIGEIARAIRNEIPEIAARRVPAIVRTEIGRAVDEGTKQALKASASVTHVSVYGCKAREASSPQYNGGSTCNAVDVPIQDIDLLRFHPQHTGCIVPSRFVGG